MTRENEGLPASLVLEFQGDLPHLLRKPHSGSRMIHRLTRRASIKDIIESQGIPHTEIGTIYCNNKELTFSYLPQGGEHLTFVPFTAKIPVTSPTVLRPKSLPSLGFIVDINVRKLSKYLRMIGQDAILAPETSVREIADFVAREEKIIITRNRDVLKCRHIVFGQLLRSQDPFRQLLEVVERYDLWEKLKPFSRCLECNGHLVAVDKQSIIHTLLPLTKKYYHLFKQCDSCGNIYWHGSHAEGMDQSIQMLLKSKDVKRDNQAG